MPYPLKPIAPGLVRRWLTVCRMAVLEITGYATAIFLAEMLVKIGSDAHTIQRSNGMAGLRKQDIDTPWTGYRHANIQDPSP